MEPHPNGLDPRTVETPGRMLDDLRDHPEWSESWRDAHFNRLIARFAPAELIEAARTRLDDLGGNRGEAVLRLVEALATPALLAALAAALVGQPGLPADREWVALELLHGAGLLGAFPDLAERWEDLCEGLEDEEGSIESLAEQIEDDPDGCFVAYRGLGGIEPQIRSEIIAGLAGGPLGPGLVAFLRQLAFSDDPQTRSATIAGLSARGEDEPATRTTWAALAADHFDPVVVAMARRRLGSAAGSTLAVPERTGPRLLDGLVTAMDGRGRGYLVLAAEDRGRPVACAFRCDANLGVIDVLGHEGPFDGFLGEFADAPGRDAVTGVPDLALGLLAGSVLLTGPVVAPALREWLGRTAGPHFRPQPFAGPFGAWDPSSIPMAEMPARAEAVLGSCRGWVDDSHLTYKLAEEIELREGPAPADPRRDAGAYRFLFEHRLLGRLELYRRMLLWMSAFWHACADPELAHSALALAAQLSDPQHAVPGHPFAVVLSTRSLDEARANLRSGIDLRDPAARARIRGGSE